MFGRILSRSFRGKKSRTLIALLAILVGSTVSSALLSVYYDIQAKMTRELRAYGPNLRIVPAAGTAFVSTDSLAPLAALRAGGRIFDYAASLVTPAIAGGERLLAVGTEWTALRRMNPAFRVEGNELSEKPGQAYVRIGKRVAERFHLAPGDVLTLRAPSHPEDPADFQIAAVLVTGGPEESEVFLPLAVAQAFFRAPGHATRVDLSVPGGAHRVEELAAELAGRMPGTRPEPIRRIAESEGKILARFRILMVLVTGIILASAGLSVMTTMYANVAERRKEIALMKALGAGDRRVLALLLSEIGIIGLAAGILGYGLGLLLAQAIGRSVFHSGISPRLFVVPLVTLVTLGLSVGASIPPVTRALAIEPATALKEE